MLLLHGIDDPQAPIFSDGSAQLKIRREGESYERGGSARSESLDREKEERKAHP